jgi:hypothetical protein
MVPMTDLENLPTDIQDLAVASPEEAKKAQRRADLLPEDYYTVVLNNWDWGRKDGQINTSNLELKELEIIDADNRALIGRKARFIRIFTTPYVNRDGACTSGLGEIIAGIDDNANWSVTGDPVASARNATAILNDAVANRTPIRLKFQWGAFDKDYFNEQGGRDMTKEDAKALRKTCQIRGVRNFPIDETGAPIPEWVGPTGNIVEARLDIDRVIPSSRRK